MTAIAPPDYLGRIHFFGAVFFLPAGETFFPDFFAPSGPSNSRRTNSRKDWARVDRRNESRTS